jgi:hypothetical protein
MNKNTNDALATIINAHTDLADAASTIIDYLDDPAAISSPSLINALDSLIDDAPEPDITAILEMITPLDADLAREIADQGELCPTCFSDLDICDC